jgi:hypothetical protein
MARLNESPKEWPPLDQDRPEFIAVKALSATVRFDRYEASRIADRNVSYYVRRDFPRKGDFGEIGRREGRSGKGSIELQGTRRRRKGEAALTRDQRRFRLKARRLFMSGYPPPPPGPVGVGQRLEEAMELIEMELRHAIAYVNDAVVPQVRSESISAMRKVSDTLRNLADRMEQSSQGRRPVHGNPEQKSEGPQS